jgi:hypothetical protein
MNRTIYEKQTHRSEIWDSIFLVPSETQVISGSSQQSSMPCISPSPTLPSYPPTLRSTTVIRTNLNVPSSLPASCNATNRKTWTAAQRSKAVQAEDTNLKSLTRWVS